MTADLHIPIITDQGKTFFLDIYADKKDTIEQITEVDAELNGESVYQLREGCFYDYELSDSNFKLELSEVVTSRKSMPHLGRISPNIFVGTLSINVLNKDNQQVCGIVYLEVRSVKTKYRIDYRSMLSEITEKCTELLMLHSSLVSQKFKVDFEKENRALYQRFAFIKSVLDSPDFNDAISRIIQNPVTSWQEEETERDIRSAKRIDNKALRQIASVSNRISTPVEHHFHKDLHIHSIPRKLKSFQKKETIDTVENRFIKYALSEFLSFVADFKNAIKKEPRVKKEAIQLESALEGYLSHSVFKEISKLTTLPLNNPVLHRKEGYREILRIWLMFDLAASLIWKGGDDVYDAGKRDVARLYEYWLFFKLLDLVGEVFRIEPEALQKLIVKTDDGLGLQLRQGKHIAIDGVFVAETRKFNIQFSYNRTFRGNSEYPDSGSWTRELRPDYSLSIWPLDISDVEAEKQELMVHIHFDAKYKIKEEYIKDIFKIENFTENEEGIIEELNIEEEEEAKGNYNRVDLLKMHSYRDAIRRTSGAYILYPGSEKYVRSGFHEIMPGLGAFAIKPSGNDCGIEKLKKFLLDVIEHIQNRTSQRERLSYRVYDIHRDKPIDELKELIPETIGQNRDLLPDETSILVAFYHKENWDWHKMSGLFHARTENRRGSLRIGKEVAGAKFLLLHSEDETKADKLFRIVGTGPRVFSKQALIKQGCPSEPSHDFYLLFNIKLANDIEFLHKHWDISKLRNYKRGRGSALPFYTTLAELMKVVVK